MELKVRGCKVEDRVWGHVLGPWATPTSFVKILLVVIWVKFAIHVSNIIFFHFVKISSLW